MYFGTPAAMVTLSPFASSLILHISMLHCLRGKTQFFPPLNLKKVCDKTGIIGWKIDSGREPCRWGLLFTFLSVHGCTAPSLHPQHYNLTTVKHCYIYLIFGCFCVVISMICMCGAIWAHKNSNVLTLLFTFITSHTDKRMQVRWTTHALQWLHHNFSYILLLLIEKGASLRPPNSKAHISTWVVIQGSSIMTVSYFNMPLNFISILS